MTICCDSRLVSLASWLWDSQSLPAPPAHPPSLQAQWFPFHNLCADEALQCVFLPPSKPTPQADAQGGRKEQMNVEAAVLRPGRYEDESNE